MTVLPPPNHDYQSFRWLEMDDAGRFLNDDGQPVPTALLSSFLKKRLAD